MDSVELVLNTMRETFGSLFATYYNGDPEAIPLFNLPALIVMQNGSDAEEVAAGEDDVTDRITIKLVLTKRDDFTTTLDPEKTTESRLRALVGQRTESGSYETATVHYALRSALLADSQLAIAPSMTVEYDWHRVSG